MSWRDLVCRRRLQLLDRVGGNRGWLREMSAYYRGMTEQEFWVRHTPGRMGAATLWERKPRTTEADHRSFYAESDEAGGDENLTEAAAERSAAIEYLNRTLGGVTPLAVAGADVIPGHYVKPRR